MQIEPLLQTSQVEHVLLMAVQLVDASFFILKIDETDATDVSEEQVRVKTDLPDHTGCALLDQSRSGRSPGWVVEQARLAQKVMQKVTSLSLDPLLASILGDPCPSLLLCFGLNCVSFLLLMHLSLHLLLSPVQFFIDNNIRQQ